MSELNHSKAIFAGGCFWCLESDLQKIEGVKRVTSGYIGGAAENASYEQVSTGTTGHREAVCIEYDADRISYKALLDLFWHNIDPFDAGGQFADRGYQYTTAIYTLDEAQKEQAEQSLAAYQARFTEEIATEIVEAGPFYEAEEYHQQFSTKNPGRYQSYRNSCGRDQRLKTLWAEG